MGIALANIIGRVKGERHRSKLLHSLSTGAYAKKFDKSEGPNAWLSSDAEAIADHDSDPFATFRFTTSAYRDLFTMLRRSNSSEWFKEYPKSLPALIMSGNDDPVGNFGKGPAYVYKQMLIAGCEQVALKTYDGARHELFLEKNRETVFADMVKWLDGIIKQQ
jgi:alpha-beta hydrolase superfamily lysophospholipase